MSADTRNLISFVDREIVIGLACFSAGILVSKIISTRSVPNDNLAGSAYYEMENTLSQYLLMHYGKHDEQMVYKEGPTKALDYPTACVHYLISKANPVNRLHALEVGCAAGRSAFELSKYYENVDAIDKSSRFIDVCRKLQQYETVEYSICDEGDIKQKLTAKCPKTCHPERISFLVGDACEDLELYKNQRRCKGLYDCVLAINVIDRMRDPSKFLLQIAEIVAKKGIVLIGSPYSWSDKFTDKANWLGGKCSGSEQFRSRDVIVKIMKERHFDLAAEDDFQMLIRETAREYEWTITHVLVFKSQVDILDIAL